MSVRFEAMLTGADHILNDPLTDEVYLAPSESEVLLLEVSRSVNDRAEVLPFRLAASDGSRYTAVVILVSPGDWAMIQNKKLELPPAFEQLELLFFREKPDDGPFAMARNANARKQS